MQITLHVTAQIALVGLVATALMDAWLMLLSRLGVPMAGFAMIGRWVGHMARGRFVHAAIARAPAIRGELALGWLTHYAVGVAYAAMLVAWQGSTWLARPTPLPALIFGVLSVAAPWLVMQPAMGAGLLARKTPAPLKTSLRNLANHTVFGIGLYLAAVGTSLAA